MLALPLGNVGFSARTHEALGSKTSSSTSSGSLASAPDQLSKGLTAKGLARSGGLTVQLVTALGRGCAVAASIAKWTPGMQGNLTIAMSSLAAFAPIANFVTAARAFITDKTVSGDDLKKMSMLAELGKNVVPGKFGELLTHFGPHFEKAVAQAGLAATLAIALKLHEYLASLAGVEAKEPAEPNYPVAITELISVAAPSLAAWVAELVVLIGQWQEKNTQDSKMYVANPDKNTGSIDGAPGVQDETGGSVEIISHTPHEEVPASPPLNYAHTSISV